MADGVEQGARALRRLVVAPHGGPKAAPPPSGKRAAVAVARRRVPLCLLVLIVLFSLNSAHAHSIVEDISCHIHTLDAEAVRRVLSWRLLLPPTNHAIPAARYS